MMSIRQRRDVDVRAADVVQCSNRLKSVLDIGVVQQQRDPGTGPVTVLVPRREPSPTRRSLVDGKRVPLAEPQRPPQPDVDSTGLTRVEHSVGDAKTYMKALLEDGVELAFVNRHVADIREIAHALHKNTLQSTCVTVDDEDIRRREVLLAVDEVRKCLRMPAWPVFELQHDSWDDVCAFEALIFLACPSSLVRTSVSLARATLRGLFGQRQLCGYIDSALLCAGSPNVSSKQIALLFLKATAQSHVDIATNAGFMTMTNNVSLSFSNGTTLAKTFMLVEELLLSNSFSHGLVSTAKHAYEDASKEKMCVTIERNGDVAFTWTAMLHELISGQEISTDLSKTRYPRLQFQKSPAGTYLNEIFELASAAWWTNSLVLPTALHLINAEDARAFHASGCLTALRGTTSTYSCLAEAEANTLFWKTKSLRPLQVMSGKTWAITSGCLYLGAGALLETTTNVIAVTSTAFLMGNAAPMTATFVGLEAVAIIRSWAGDGAADYLLELALRPAMVIGETVMAGAFGEIQRVAWRWIPELTRLAVRQGTGRAARLPIEVINTAAMGAATGASYFFTVNTTRMQFNDTVVGEAAIQAVTQREGSLVAGLTSIFASLRGAGWYFEGRSSVSAGLAVITKRLLRRGRAAQLPYVPNPGDA